MLAVEAMKCAKDPCQNEAMSGGLLCWLCAHYAAEEPPKKKYRPRAMSPEMRIKHEVCREMGISLQQLTSRYKTRFLVTARRRVARRLRNELGFSYSQIGAQIGRSDHTTVINLLRERGPVLHMARKGDE